MPAFPALSNKLIGAFLALAFASHVSALAPAKVSPDPAPWQGFLSRYVDTSAADGVHRVRYAAVTPADKASVHAYLKSAQAVPVSALPKEEQRAFWINLYNAQTVSVVLDHYPLKSVLDLHLPGSPKPGPWDSKLLRVEGKDLSLNDIESGILRVQWKDPRIHFALNCASIGCPSLSARVFTPANLDKQLESGARDFMRSQRAVSLSAPPKEAKLTISSIFDWYRGDFGAGAKDEKGEKSGKDEKDVLGFIARYAPPETAARIKAWSGKIDYGYDWNLNDAAPK
jgi:hypothetical protein